MDRVASQEAHGKRAALAVLGALVAARVVRPIVIERDGAILLAGPVDRVAEALEAMGETALATELRALLAEPVAVVVEIVGAKARVSSCRLEPLARGGCA